MESSGTHVSPGIRFILAAMVIGLMSSTLLSQSALQLGTLQYLNANISINQAWTLNARLESRQFEFMKHGSDRNVGFDYERTHVSLHMTRQSEKGVSAGSGYLMRFQDGYVSHRFMQSLIVDEEQGSTLFRHRFIADATVSSQAIPVWRLRYRFIFERPLIRSDKPGRSGRLRGHSEILGILQNGEGNLEIWSGAAYLIPLGRAVTIEPGIDYRIRGFVRNSTRHQFWLNIGATISL